MRNIVFSFDDGLLDFSKNALPIFEKYGFKASLNIVTSYAEKGEIDGYKYLGIAELKTLEEKGFELACHSDRHSDHTSFEDFKFSLIKMQRFFGNKKYGAILPYSQNIDDATYGGIRSTFLYLADYPFTRRKNNFYYRFSYYLGKLFKNNNLLFYYKNFSYFYNCDNGFYTFKRLPIKKEQNAKLYIHFLKHMPNNSNLTFMLHSIVDYDEKCPWKDGAWAINELDKLLRFLSKHKSKFNILTQKEIGNE